MSDIALSQEDIDNLLSGGLDDAPASTPTESDPTPSLGGGSGSDNIFDGLDDLLPDSSASSAPKMSSSSGGGIGTASAPASKPMSTVSGFGLDNVEATGNLSILLNVIIDINVELGKKSLMIKEILSLGEGSIIELDKSAGDPVDILANNRPLARGEVVVVDEQFGVRITEKVNPQTEA